MLTPRPEAPCPCGRPRYTRCCGCRIDGGEAAADAETLMRSRYTAFVLDRRDHLLSTWHPTTRPAFIEAPRAGLKWLGLDVRAACAHGPDAATVEFIARSKIAGRAHRLHERSRFVREAGRWYYVDREVDPPARSG